MEGTARVCYIDGSLAVTTCSECNNPICTQCRQVVAGHDVCTSCVDKIRARVSAEIETAASPGVPLPVSTVPGPPTADQPVAATIPPAESVPQEPAQPAAPPSPLRILVGIALGLAAGWLGAFIRAQVLYRFQIQFGLIDSFIGFGVGLAVVMGSGRSGIVPAIIGGIIAFLSITYGWYLAYSYAGAELFGGQAQMRPFLEVAPDIIKRWDVMDWLFVAIGVYGGFITPFRAGSPSAETGRAA